MLTYQDCLDMCDFTEEEIRAIAEHEHVPEIVALEFGEYLIHGDDGVLRISKIILDDIVQAQEEGQSEHAEHLRNVLKHFIATHPEHPRG